MTKRATKRAPKPKHFELIEVRDARALQGFMAHVIFTDETERDIDLEPYLHGPIFEPIRTNPKIFRAMRVEGGTIAWANEADIAPETLYYGEQDPPWIKAPKKTQPKSKHSPSGESKTAKNNERIPKGRKPRTRTKATKVQVRAKPRVESADRT